jgi:MinD-like ATPase involved in chromosome partitioning or flagellar assembly
VVTGAVGGAGTTTVAALLGLTLSEEERRPVLVLDAAPGGGDLAARVFGPANTGAPWEPWARQGANPRALHWQLNGKDFGAAFLTSEGFDHDAPRLIPLVIDTLTAKGWVVVVDAGSGAGSAVTSAALDAGAALVVVIPQRADGANRARLFLSRLTARRSRTALSDAVVVVSDHGLRQQSVYRAVSTGLGTAVSAVLRIPYERRFADGLTLTATTLGQATRSAANSLIDALTATRPATTHPAR